MNSHPRRISRPLVAGASFGVGLFILGVILGVIRTLALTPWMGRAAAVWVELPIMFVITWLLVPLLLGRLSIKRTYNDRLIMSCVGLAIGMGLEVGLGVLVQRQSPSTIIFNLLSAENRFAFIGQISVFFIPVFQLSKRAAKHKNLAKRGIDAKDWQGTLSAFYSALNTGPNGLSRAQAEALLAQNGPNLIKDCISLSVPRLIFDRLREPLALMLLSAAALSALSGDTASFGLILTMVLIGVVFDVAQESRANRAAGLLRDSVAMQANVLRDCAWISIPSEQIVTGDIIKVHAGDIVPADGLIVSAKALTVNEASLTGEPYPVPKSAFLPAATSTEKDGPRLVQDDMLLFCGVPVVSGTAQFVITQTGRDTQIGQLADQLRRPAPLGALERGIKAFGFLIVRATMSLLLVVLIAHTLAGRPFLESLMFALALAVGMTPELLPMVTSVTLSRGAVRMAKRHVIVKRLGAIHDLGAMDVLCTDKTGTLTDAKISYAQALAFDGKVDDKVLLLAHLNAAFSHGTASPMDDALRAARPTPNEWTALDEVPFDFDRRRVSVLVAFGDKSYLITKGAPDETLAVCSYFGVLGDTSVHADKRGRQAARKHVDLLGAQGERALAVAWKEMPEHTTVCTLEDEHGLSLAGFVTFIDPPKTTAAEALKSLAALGVNVMILTGDSAPVTRRVCDQLGFEVRGISLGDQIAKLDDSGLSALLRQSNVFCRLNPVQKNRIVLSLKRAGHVVGYVGDGINDAPSLHDADVGLSVEGAVSVAREAADIILLEPDLAILAEGVREGRRTFSNIMKYIMMAVSSNFGNMLSMAGAALFLPFLPMTALQILLNNLIYDFASTAIPFDSVDEQDVASPRTWDIGHITRFMLVMGPVSSLFDVLTFLVLTKGFHSSETGFHSAWFIESLLTQVLVVLIIRTRKAPWQSQPNRLILVALGVAAILAFAIPFSPLGSAFGLSAVPLGTIAAIVGLTFGYLLAAEIAKRVFYYFEDSRLLANKMATPV